MFTKSSLTEHPVRVKIATRAQTEQFALLSEQHWYPQALPFLISVSSSSQRRAINRFIPASRPWADRSYMGNIFPSFQWVWLQ